MRREKLISNIRNVPDFPIPGIQFKDVTTLFKDSECLQILSDIMYEMYKDKGITKVVGIESRGFIMGPILATRLNAGFIPKNIWVHDLEIGGGRIIGEACHFIDLSVYMTNSFVKNVSMSSLGNKSDASTDNAIITLKFENGAQAVINYFSNGSKSYSKERIEFYTNNKTLVIDNFKEMIGYGFKNFKKMKSKQDKGHFEQFRRYFEFLENGGKPLIPFDELVNVSKASFAAIESLKSGKTVEVS